MKNKILLRLEAFLGAWLLRLWRKTIRWKVTGQPPKNFPCVFAFWHRDLLILTMQQIDSNAVVMVSTSQEGELIAGPLSRLGYLPVRGSTTRQGSLALKKMLRLSQTRTLAITPDGPVGPPGFMHQGLFQISYLGKVPIIPIRVEARHIWNLPSWDRLRVPRPFTTIRVHYGEHIPVLGRADFSAAEAAIRKFLANPRSELE